jgi:hypothetical protein
LFYYLLYLAALPSTEREYHRRGISMAIFDHTMSDLRIWLCHYKDVEGRWGFGEFGWIWHHVTCSLFRLGRLQYELAPFRDNVKVFRCKKDGQILILADPDTLLRPDGYVLGSGSLEVDGQEVFKGAYPRDEGWRPVFERRDDGWRGNPVSPYGWVQREEVYIPSGEWELVLQKGDPVLDMHIPRADPFTAETCRDSLRQACEFYARPEVAGESNLGRFRAFFCHTWFFSPQLQQILPPQSNIVHFQREFYLYPPPFAGGPGFLWNFVFGDKVRDVASAPRDTSLRRAVLDWLGSGREIFDVSGVMFHSPDAWGTQPYMSRWDRSHSSASTIHESGLRNP